MKATPRLRLFAGPNGSGKSTLKEIIPNEWLGIYINPDEIEKTLRKENYLNFYDFEVTTNKEALFSFLNAHPLLNKSDGLNSEIKHLSFHENHLHFNHVEVNSYFASVLSDFIRHQLLTTQTSFTFESVMSSKDKVDFLKKAQEHGFRTYLYFVATEDPEINVQRVTHRVATGGHPVREDKIRERYIRSLNLLIDAVTYTNRAYIFDNSAADQDHVWIAEVSDGQEIELKTSEMPAWFKAALWDYFTDIEPDLE